MRVKGVKGRLRGAGPRPRRALPGSVTRRLATARGRLPGRGALGEAEGLSFGVALSVL